MAKKKASGGFNMAEEIRKLLREDRSMSGKEVYEALQKKFPNQDINKNSCGVAFYGARDALGIKSKRSKKRKPRKSGEKKVVMKRTPTSVDMGTLQAAAKFVSEVGDAGVAIEAIRQLKTLQIQ